MTILDRYLLRTQLPPFLFAFFTVMFVFLINYLTRFLDRLVGKGIEIQLIIELLSLQLAWMVVVAAPIGMLSSSLMAFGNLSGALEITAMQAGGISPIRLMLPPLFAGLLLAFGVERFGNEVLPEANHLAKVLTMDITKKKPSFGLEENVFSDMIQGYSILVQKTYENSSKVDGIIIYDYTTPQKNTVIRAKTADFAFSRDNRYLIMTLDTGEMHELDRDTQTGYKRIKFDKHVILFNGDGFGFSRSDESTVSRSDRELSANNMMQICDSLKRQYPQTYRRLTTIAMNTAASHLLLHSSDTAKSIATYARLDSLYFRKNLPSPEKQSSSLGFILSKVPFKSYPTYIDAVSSQVGSLLSQIDGECYSYKSTQNQINRYLVEIHKKYSIPFACLFFVFVGMPLGVLARRGGVGVGAGFSLLFFMIYWGSLISGEKLADRDIIPPFVSMWIGNSLLLIIGIFFIWKMSGFHIPKFLATPFRNLRYKFSYQFDFIKRTSRLTQIGVEKFKSISYFIQKIFRRK
ncbi:MAG: LptF/LptG family permease [Chloroherpetonaceae bacterium]|nr:LptF/LptG family permease [Chloroherpetonaceae bacterium]